MKKVKKVLLVLFLLLVFLLVLIGASDNSSAVSLVFLDYGTPELPIAWWILLAFAAGTLLGWVMSLGGTVRSRVTTMKVKKELSKSNAALEKVQNNNGATDH